MLLLLLPPFFVLTGFSLAAVVLLAPLFVGDAVTQLLCFLKRRDQRSAAVWIVRSNRLPTKTLYQNQADLVRFCWLVLMKAGAKRPFHALFRTARTYEKAGFFRD